MTTLFVDYEGGNNNYGGTSFDLIEEGTDGQLSIATFTSSNANFDDSVVGHYLSIFNGTSYLTYKITSRNSQTQLTVEQISGGSALTTINVDRQYYIGGRWKDIGDGATALRIAPGDTIRIMGSPNPTSLGIGATWRVESGTDNLSVFSATNATPIVITTFGSHNLSSGDYIYLQGMNGLTSANGTWEVNVTSSNEFELIGSKGNGNRTFGGTFRQINSKIVTLDSSLTKTIASTGIGTDGSLRNVWTAKTNVTTSLDTTFAKEHAYSDRILINSTFTTGIAAYYTLPTELDLSVYQQISFWIRQSSGVIISDNDCSLVLCSDTAGAVGVNTINIPTLSSLNYWKPITVNVGTALSSSVKSIAFLVNVDKGAQTFNINNIIACKSDSSDDALTLTSLIGKNTANDTWYSIQSIDENRIVLDNNPFSNITNSSQMSFQGYYPVVGIPTTENVTTYKRETIKFSGPHIIQDSGTEGNLIRYEGGWDRTDMSTQNHETWFDGLDSFKRGIYVAGKSYVGINSIACVRCFDNYYFAGYLNGVEVDYIPALNNGANGLSFENVSTGSTSSVYINNIYAVSGNNRLTYTLSLGSGIGLYNSTGVVINSVNIINQADSYPFTCSQTYGKNIFNNITMRGCKISFSNQGFLNIYGSDQSVYIENLNFDGGNVVYFANTGSSYLVQFNSSTGNVIGNFISTDNYFSYSTSFYSSYDNYINSGISTDAAKSTFYNSRSHNNYVKNFILNSNLDYSSNIYDKSNLYFINYNNVQNSHNIRSYGGEISSDTSVTSTGSGISWKFNPTNIFISEVNPLKLSLAKIAVNSNSEVSVACSMRRNNTGLTMKLVIPDGQIAGIPTGGISSSMTAGANTWETVSLSFVPTETGVVEIFAHAYGGTTYSGYVDNMTII